MPAGRHKSGTFRKVIRRTPGGKLSVQYKKRKPQAAKCSECGTTLMGVPRALPSKMTNMPKTRKRPERPYGGSLCSKCMRQKIVETVQ